MRRAPKDVIFCIKATPHDFYPTFPHNTAIGRLRDRVQWIEYDTMGQFYGLAIAPCYVGGDMAERLDHAERNGVRSEEHTSELQSLMRISYAVFCLKKKRHKHINNH